MKIPDNFLETSKFHEISPPQSTPFKMLIYFFMFKILKSGCLIKKTFIQSKNFIKEFTFLWKRWLGAFSLKFFRNFLGGYLKFLFLQPILCLTSMTSRKKGQPVISLFKGNTEKHFPRRWILQKKSQINQSWSFHDVIQLL